MEKKARKKYFGEVTWGEDWKWTIRLGKIEATFHLDNHFSGGLGMKVWLQEAEEGTGGEEVETSWGSYRV